MGSVDLPLHLTDHLNIFNLKMKFLILASLFVLSVVADPEAEAEAIRPLDLTHKTSGFVRYTNGAITPEDTDSVKAAKIQHHTLKAALTENKKTPFAYAFNHQVYQPQVYGVHGVHHQQQFAAQNFYGLHRQQQAFAPQVYGVHGVHHQQQFVAPQVYGLHRQQQVYQPRGVFGMPAVRHLGKRDAEAEPEAEAEAKAEAEAQYLSSQYYGQYYGTPASTYPLTRGFQGYPYAAAYTTGYPSTYNTALTGYPSTYNSYNPRVTGYPNTYNTALTGYPNTYNTALTGYPSTYNTAYTGYPSMYNSAYTGYPNTYNTGYPSIYKAALYNKAQVQARKVVSGPAVQKA